MINIKNKPAKIVSLVLCGVLTFSAVGVGAYAAGTKNADNNTKVEEKAASSEDTKDTQGATKDETVYVIAGADGSVQKVIVSDWIKNSLESSSLTDKTDLENIQNVKGDESYSINGDNAKVWDAEGNDIYYTGDIDKEIPVDMKISYKLNGKNVSADELAGASGEVTIHFDYKNNQYEMVEIDGKQEKIYVPFAMITGMMLDNDKFSNVRVSNGKVINDGSHTIVAGLAFPGLSENLQLDSDEIEIPDYVEITADVEDFELTTTLTMASNEVFNEVDLGDSDSIDELEDSMNKLTDAMSKLLDGSSKLYDGVSTLLDKSNELVGYINQFAAAAKDIKDGAAKVDAGTESLQGYISQLSEGLNTLVGNNDKLNGGAKQVFETLLSTAQTQLTAAGLTVPTLTIDNYNTVLDKIIESLDEDNVYKQALQTVTAEVEKNRPVVEAGVTAAVKQQVEDGVKAAAKQKVEAGARQQVLEGVLNTKNMTVDAYNAAVSAGRIDEATQNAINAAVDAQMASEDVQKQIEATMASEDVQNQIKAGVEQQMASEAIKKTISDNTEAKIQSLINENMQSETVKETLKKASEGLASVSELKGSLNSYNEFYTGLLQYTSGAATAASGAAQLASGASQLKSGTSELAAGTNEFYNKFIEFQSGSGALVDGVSQLKDGAMQLSDGLKQFNEEGIQKLSDAVNGDLGNLAARLKATIDVSKDYKSFAGISDDMDGKVRFIYKTDAIEKED